MATMGERIKQLRKEIGMTQTELAEKIGVTKGTVSTWETDSRKPTFGKLIKLCDLFDKDPGYVMGTQDEPGHMEHMTAEETIACALNIMEEQLADYALKYVRLDEYGRRAVQAVILEEENRCRAQDSLAPAGNYQVYVTIRRDSVLQQSSNRAYLNLS